MSARRPKGPDPNPPSSQAPPSTGPLDTWRYHRDAATSSLGTFWPLRRTVARRLIARPSPPSAARRTQSTDSERSPPSARVPTLRLQAAACDSTRSEWRYWQCGEPVGFEGRQTVHLWLLAAHMVTGWRTLLGALTVPLASMVFTLGAVQEPEDCGAWWRWWRWSACGRVGGGESGRPPSPPCRLLGGDLARSPLAGQWPEVQTALWRGPSPRSDGISRRGIHPLSAARAKLRQLVSSKVGMW